uniref:sensor histidine kinase n=1 Tax=Desulfobacca sp. TaxID=2067990 RepID=UPI00404936B2
MERTSQEISQRLPVSQGAAEMAVLLVDNLARVLGARGAVLQLYQAPAATPILTRAWGWGERYETRRLPEPKPLRAGSGQPQVLVLHQPELAAYLAATNAGAEAIETLIWLPLGGQQDWWGSLAFLFDRRQEPAAARLADLAALAQQSTCVLTTMLRLAKQQQEFAWLAQQTEQLTALGRLAAGVAHELNNPLASILLYSSNLLKKVPTDGPLHEGLSVIIQETERGKALIQELLELARRKEPKKVVANLNAILAKVTNLLKNEFRRRSVRLHQDLEAQLPDLLIDIGQLQQVFVHLLLNALEAVPAEGEVALTSRWDREQQSAIITITDNGCGIPPENLPRLFEPFFSTKPRSTGLGLTVSLNFVQNHHGDLQVTSRPGQGTCVTVTIPSATGPTRAPRSGL